VKIEQLAALVLEQSRQVIAGRYGQQQANAETVSVRRGNVYTKIDRGTSGYLMVEMATGNIYGIKAYGKVHKGHAYGTLGTAGEWFWGECSPVMRKTS
jgi:hypothetical protein